MLPIASLENASISRIEADLNCTRGYFRLLEDTVHTKHLRITFEHAIKSTVGKGRMHGR
jgi:hypothetical protein